MENQTERLTKEATAREVAYIEKIGMRERNYLLVLIAAVGVFVAVS